VINVIPALKIKTAYISLAVIKLINLLLGSLLLLLLILLLSFLSSLLHYNSDFYYNYYFIIIIISSILKIALLQFCVSFSHAQFVSGFLAVELARI
jgi:hypothetical protein